MVSESDKEDQYGQIIERVRRLFNDGKPHLPKEATKISANAYVNVNLLFCRGFLLRTRKHLNYTYVEKGKWRRMRGFMYIGSDSPLLGPNNTLEWEFKQTERWTFKTTIVKRLLNFINYEQSKRLQADMYKQLLSSKEITKYFEERGLGATTRIIAEDFDVDVARMSTQLRAMVARGEIIRMGKWNPKLGCETVFRGKFQGYVYGLDHEQCKMFIQSGKVLTQEANAMFKEVIKNSNEKRLTPLYVFTDAPYHFDPANVTYHANSLVNTFKNVERIESNTGHVFLYIKGKMAGKDVELSIKYWNQRLSKKRSFGNVIGDMHEIIVQTVLDEMSEEETDRLWKPKHAFDLPILQRARAAGRSTITNPQ